MPNDLPASGAAEQRLADDLIQGARGIAAEIGEKQRRVEYMLEQRLIPARKVGRRWYASRAQLRAHFLPEEPARK
jgi:hypothetical protein